MVYRVVPIHKWYSITVPLFPAFSSRFRLLPAQPCQSKHLIYWLGRLWRRFLLPKCHSHCHCHGQDTPHPVLPFPYQSASQSVYDESHLAFAWFALFIYSSILSDCLAVSLLSLSISLFRTLYCYLTLTAVSASNCISHHSLPSLTKSIRIRNRTETHQKPWTQSSMMPSLKSKADLAEPLRCPLPHPALPCSVVVHAA